ncbi:MAG: hypothetical protein R3E96_09780 [Planctomycetota bacterium]
MIELGSTDAEARKALLVRVSEVVEVAGGASIPLAEAARQVLPLVAEGRAKSSPPWCAVPIWARSLLRKRARRNVMFAAARS